MTRIILKVALFLALAAVLNVLLAWACVLWSPLGPRTYQWYPGRPPLVGCADWPAPAAEPSWRHGWGIDETVSIARDDPIERTGTGWWRLEAGYPARCMAAEIESPLLPATRRNRLNPPPLPEQRSWRTGQAIPEWIPRTVDSKARRLPVRPVWRGLFVNVIGYAAIFTMLYYSPFVLRRMIRRERGRCLDCGYDLRGEFNAGCPECGWNRAEHRP